jgi:hypothetical protein
LLLTNAFSKKLIPLTQAFLMLTGEVEFNTKSSHSKPQAGQQCVIGKVVLIDCFINYHFATMLQN